ncbi:MAG: hypothetical protein Unbinned4585contig1001_3 [Prokaryotic dsDNA virus sp.]|nr:MAG: hypothetical protein Unbinned4585contig1001_3 [Prokaryotic dsDNA virus sp.]|tara:strand:+ start:551 stop:718 length:168 start_codon:yes stop_codon:yes gene_type:complete
MRKKVKKYDDLSPITKGWIFSRLKHDETIPQIAKHFNVSIDTVNKVIEEKVKTWK